MSIDMYLESARSQATSFIPTNELYKLVLEWKEMEDRMRRGEDIFPVTLED